MSDYANQTFAALCDLSPSSHCDYEFDLALIQKKPDYWPFVHIDVPSKGTVLYFLPSYLASNNAVPHQGRMEHPTSIMERELSVIETVDEEATFIVCQYGVVRSVSRQEAVSVYKHAVEVVCADYANHQNARRYKRAK